MVNSYDTSPDIARTSPGEIIITRLLQSLCERGVSEFDLGVGEAAYKDKWCDRSEPLFDTFHGVTAKGKARTLSALLQEIAEVRRTGIAYDREEHSPGICAVGVAFSDQGGTIYAISIPVPANRAHAVEVRAAELLLPVRDRLRRLFGT